MGKSRQTRRQAVGHFPVAALYERRAFRGRRSADAATFFQVTRAVLPLRPRIRRRSVFAVRTVCGAGGGGPRTEFHRPAIALQCRVEFVPPLRQARHDFRMLFRPIARFAHVGAEVIQFRLSQQAVLGFEQARLVIIPQADGPRFRAPVDGDEEFQFASRTAWA